MREASKRLAYSITDILILLLSLSLTSFVYQLSNKYTAMVPSLRLTYTAISLSLLTFKRVSIRVDMGVATQRMLESKYDMSLRATEMNTICYYKYFLFFEIYILKKVTLI